VFLSVEVVTTHLTEVAEDIQAGRLDQAEMKLEGLAFERLTILIPYDGRLMDPAAGFGGGRKASETGTHISSCERAVKRGDAKAGLREAQLALARWAQPEGE
jgi:hypothetical protein